MPWFMQRVRAGRVLCPHPFTGQVLEISLRPEHVHSIVFWTKNGRPLLAHVDELEDRGYPFACHFTITGVPRGLEPAVPDWRDAADAFARLSRRTGPARVWWRFDPILLTEELGPAHYLQRFAELATALEGMTSRCYLSFATLYGKVERRLRAASVAALDPGPDVRQSLVQDLAQIAAARGMELLSCCGDDLVVGTVRKARCIDAELLDRLFPDRELHAPPRPTRQQCGCSASRDIGMYDTCLHQCVYCYANQDPERVRGRHGRHDPSGPMLVPASLPAVPNEP
jgi:hypothetical protein